MEKITYRELADHLGKSENTIKGWKQKFPELLEVCKIGTFCKKNNITIDKIVKCKELQDLATKD